MNELIDLVKRVDLKEFDKLENEAIEQLSRMFWIMQNKLDIVRRKRGVKAIEIERRKYPRFRIIACIVLFCLITTSAFAYKTCPLDKKEWYDDSCLERSGITWVHYRVTEDSWCCTNNCIRIIKTPKSRVLEQNKYCIDVNQNGNILAIYAETNKHVPVEILKEMFCTEGE